MENPLLGANRKAKRIKSLLKHKWRASAPTNALASAALHPTAVFLSDPDLKVDLQRSSLERTSGRTRRRRTSAARR
jgi:hypothetical protein